MEREESTQDQVLLIVAIVEKEAMKDKNTEIIVTEMIVLETEDVLLIVENNLVMKDANVID
jgi:hypothetical protein